MSQDFRKQLEAMSAEEIVDLLFDMPFEKVGMFATIFAKRCEQMQARSERIARRKADNDFRSFLEGGEE